MVRDPDHHLVLQGTVSDRFGDHGVVICATTRIDGGEARISSLLMSCRVIARNVEFAFLGALIEALKQRGVTTVIGEFIPTERNRPAAGFLEKAGFVPVADTETNAGLSIWRAGEAAVPASASVELQQ